MRTPWAMMYVLSPSPAKRVRVSCIVGKKVDRRAVARHRYQRWLREIFRHWSQRLPRPADVVIVALPPIKDMARLTELRDGLVPYWRRLANE